MPPPPPCGCRGCSPTNTVVSPPAHRLLLPSPLHRLLQPVSPTPKHPSQPPFIPPSSPLHPPFQSHTSRPRHHVSYVTHLSYPLRLPTHALTSFKSPVPSHPPIQAEISDRSTANAPRSALRRPRAARRRRPPQIAPRRSTTRRSRTRRSCAESNRKQSRRRLMPQPPPPLDAPHLHQLSLPPDRIHPPTPRPSKPLLPR